MNETVEAQNVAPAQSRGGVLSLTIREKAALYAAYLPFIKGGGIFVPTTRPASLGDHIYVMLTLMEDPVRIPLAGRVVWITPEDTPGKQRGLGIQFPDDPSGETARTRIENLIGSALKAKRPTHTI